VVRKAFKVAESEKPGATHLELPEDVMARELDAKPLPYHPPVHPEPGLKELDRAVRIIIEAEKPVALAGEPQRGTAPLSPPPLPPRGAARTGDAA